MLQLDMDTSWKIMEFYFCFCEKHVFEPYYWQTGWYETRIQAYPALDQTSGKRDDKNQRIVLRNNHIATTIFYIVLNMPYGKAWYKH